ncbi:MAG: CDC48 family AAA ATPase [Candidatus Dadabacteria bacterium]|nr:CDC48 family AAA ATPase [Candidatus Dadabacteria bacterium]NIQ16465.1 CDC48 family AAA ATPase [Candidatus Dadabacteria bacterium]
MISLKISEIPSSDFGKGFARISTANMDELGINSWELIEIGGRRKTVVRAMPLEMIEENSKESIIEIDSVTRENARVEINDFVIIKKTDSKSASKVTLSPRNKSVLYDLSNSKYIKNRLDGLPLTVGDKVTIHISSTKTEEFDVLHTTPAGPVILHQNTKLELKSKPTIKVDSTRVNYEDIGGLSDQIKKIREMIELPIKFPMLFEKLGIQPPKGLLLIGPPGSGKTLLAKAIAYETNVNFQVINGPEIIHKFYGESEAKIRQIFDVATRNQPSIIFLDELDAIAPRRDKVTGDVEKRVVAQLLTLMDGLKDRGNLVVIGATNLPNAIDPALRRPGRFDREIHLNVPDINGRLEILQVHSRSMPLSNNVDLQKIAELSHGFVGADLENLCREAALNALGKTLSDIEYDLLLQNLDSLSPLKIGMEDFLKALNEIEPSAIREILVEIPRTTWEDVGGLEKTKDDLIESVIWPMKHKNFFEAMNLKSPKGILLFGPPGTGKTLLAKALANKSEVNFISVKGAELLSKYVGESERSVREVFKKAKQVSPCIVFFDELDALAPRRTDSNTTRVSERVVSQLLTEIDGVEEISDVQILAATNRIDMVDPALLRSGRFDLILEVPKPGQNEIIDILNIHLKNKPLASDVKLTNLGKKLEDKTGADIELICNRASLFAIKEHLNKNKKILKIHNRHFTQSIKEFNSSRNTDLTS